MQESELNGIYQRENLESIMVLLTPEEAQKNNIHIPGLQPGYVLVHDVFISNYDAKNNPGTFWLANGELKKQKLHYYSPAITTERTKLFRKHQQKVLSNPEYLHKEPANDWVDEGVRKQLLDYVSKK